MRWHFGEQHNFEQCKWRAIMFLMNSIDMIAALLTINLTIFIPEILWASLRRNAVIMGMRNSFKVKGRSESFRHKHSSFAFSFAHVHRKKSRHWYHVTGIEVTYSIVGSFSFSIPYFHLTLFEHVAHCVNSTIFHLHLIVSDIHSGSISQRKTPNMTMTDELHFVNTWERISGNTQKKNAFK